MISGFETVFACDRKLDMLSFRTVLASQNSVALFEALGIVMVKCTDCSGRWSLEEGNEFDVQHV